MYIYQRTNSGKLLSNILVSNNNAEITINEGKKIIYPLHCFLACTDHQVYPRWISTPITRIIDLSSLHWLPRISLTWAWYQPHP